MRRFVRRERRRPLPLGVVDVLGRRRDRRARAELADEGGDVAHRVAALERHSHTLTRLVVRDTHGGDGVGQAPEVRLEELLAVLLEVLADIEVVLPLGVPLVRRVVQRAHVALILLIILADGRLHPLQLAHQLVELAALYQVALRRVRVHLGAVVLVLFTRTLHILHLRLLMPVQLLDIQLRRAARVLGAPEEVGQRRLDLLTDRLRELLVRARHGVRLGAHRVERITHGAHLVLAKRHAGELAEPLRIVVLDVCPAHV